MLNITMERSVIDYDELRQTIIRNSRTIALNEIDNIVLKNLTTIYSNQAICASEIVSSLVDRRIINIMVLALTQSGKTGVSQQLRNNMKNYEK